MLSIKNIFVRTNSSKDTSGTKRAGRGPVAFLKSVTAIRNEIKAAYF